MPRSIRSACLALVLLNVAGSARAHDHGTHGMGEMGSRAAATCRDPVPACAISATPAFDELGALHLIYSVSGRVYVARSADGGKSFEPAVPIPGETTAVDDNFDGRPSITIARDGTIAAAWSVWQDKNWNGMVLTSRSTDGGKTFSAPQPITKSVSQRFAWIFYAPDGALWATWLDKRNLAAAKASGDDYVGAGLAASVSRDGGATFSAAHIVSDRTCECCRVSLGFDPDGAAVVAWRQIYGKNFRDHEVGRLSADATSIVGVRVSEDDWAIDACPHHGPNLSVDATGVRHVVWYTGGKTRSGLFYARASGKGAAFSEPQGFGDPQKGPSHPQVLAMGNTVVRAWKEFDGERTTIVVQTSADGGYMWDATRVAASTTDASDHPILIHRGGQVFLSWLTKQEGYWLLPIAAGV